MSTKQIETITMAADGTVSSRSTTFGSTVNMKVDVSAVTGTTCSFTTSHINTITGVIVQALDSGNNLGTSDADVTWSGNTITVADGVSFDLSAEDVLYVTVFGTE